MMDIYFNELSVPYLVPEKDDMDGLVNIYAETVKEACKQGFNKVRYEKGVENIMLGEDYSLAQYLNENSKLASVQVLLSTQTRPYIPDGDEIEEQYVLNDYSVKCEDYEVKADGIVVAALRKSMAIGMMHEKWKEPFYFVLERACKGDTSFRCLKVLYAYDTACFGNSLFQEWADDNLEPEIIDCGIFPMEKTIKLADHHGKEVLTAFAKKLRRENYVIGIINSIDRNSKERNFISGMSGNIIYITLINDGYFGLAVSTTARNNRELRYIAKLIENKYNR